MLSCQSWRPVATLEHKALLKEAGSIAAYQEEDESARVIRSPSRSRSRYIVAECPLRMPTAKAPIDKPNPKLGIGENAPNTLSRAFSSGFLWAHLHLSCNFWLTRNPAAMTQPSWR